MIFPKKISIVFLLVVSSSYVMAGPLDFFNFFKEKQKQSTAPNVQVTEPQQNGFVAYQNRYLEHFVPVLKATNIMFDIPDNTVIGDVNRIKKLESLEIGFLQNEEHNGLAIISNSFTDMDKKIYLVKQVKRVAADEQSEKIYLGFIERDLMSTPQDQSVKGLGVITTDKLGHTSSFKSFRVAHFDLDGLNPKYIPSPSIDSVSPGLHLSRVFNDEPVLINLQARLVPLSVSTLQRCGLVLNTLSDANIQPLVNILMNQIER